jgi:hypothetical protein
LRFSVGINPFPAYVVATTIRFVVVTVVETKKRCHLNRNTITDFAIKQKLLNITRRTNNKLETELRTIEEHIVLFEKTNRFRFSANPPSRSLWICVLPVHYG